MLTHDRWAQSGILAAITGEAEGDCSWRADGTARRNCLAGLGVDPEAVVQVRQVHGREILEARAEDRGRGAQGAPSALGEGDGIYTAVRGLPLGILVADCVPLWIVSPAHRVGALVHAGRAGTELRIAEAAVQALSTRYAVAPSALEAWIGPSAGPCCYEVSTEMAEAWGQQGLPAKGRHLDLWAANALQLRAAGLPPSAIDVAGHCTICQPGYFSYRRSSDTCRNLGILAL